MYGKYDIKDKVNSFYQNSTSLHSVYHFVFVYFNKNLKINQSECGMYMYKQPCYDGLRLSCLLIPVPIVLLLLNF